MRGRPAAIVPSRDGARVLPDLLQSLRAQTVPVEVIVVDNGSTDGTAELLAERFPEVQRVFSRENLGFGRAVNRGVANCEAGTVVVLNNDVVCEPEFVELLCEALDRPGGVVMVAGVLLDAARPGRIDTAGVMFDRTLFALDYLHGRPVRVLDEAVADPLGPTGGAAAFDRSTFESVGGFDERFFAYLEDVDLAVRLRAAGGRCRLARGARALHRHSATLGSGSREKNALMGWGRGYTIAKYRLHRRPRLLARAFAGELAVTAGQLVIDRTVSGFPARLQGFRAGLERPGEPLPPLPEQALRISLLDGLRYRLSRRGAP